MDPAAIRRHRIVVIGGIIVAGVIVGDIIIAVPVIDLVDGTSEQQRESHQ